MNVATAIAARNGSPIAIVPQMISSTPHTTPHFEPCLMTANGFGAAVVIVFLSGPDAAGSIGKRVGALCQTRRCGATGSAPSKQNLQAIRPYRLTEWMHLRLEAGSWP